MIRLADLDRVPEAELQQICGKAMARRLEEIRNGTDDATVRSQRRRTSFTSEGTTAGYARADWTPLTLLEACLERVCRRAQRAGLVGSRLTLTLVIQSRD